VSPVFSWTILILTSIIASGFAMITKTENIGRRTGNGGKAWERIRASKPNTSTRIRFAGSIRTSSQAMQ